MAWFFFGISLFQTVQSQSPQPYPTEFQDTMQNAAQTYAGASSASLRYDTLRISPQNLETLSADLSANLDTDSFYLALLERPEARISKHFLENTHQPELYDTLVRIELPAAEYEFYLLPDEVFLVKAMVSQPQYQLCPKLMMGMSKNLFFQYYAFQVPPTASNLVLIVEDELDETFYSFQFENEVLTQMHYQGYVD
ncbi:hypothetical protein [Hugenholtzia roseola]|uniref:hypothetical protein n=1 Tax=Hugenholtzia roseola TaxID=1002 RepID=UPI000426E05B|nr:hypothetical protein [Hugenholtzia roseola]